MCPVPLVEYFLFRTCFYNPDFFGFVVGILVWELGTFVGLDIIFIYNIIYYMTLDAIIPSSSKRRWVVNLMRLFNFNLKNSKGIL